MSLTVTAAQSGTGAFDGMALTVRVVTGQAASPIGATASSGTVTAPELPITPAATGSYVYGAVYNANVSTAFTAATGTTFSQNTSDTGDGVAYGTFRLTATTTSGAPVSVGATAPAETAGLLSIALLEIKAGTGLAEDSSSPAAVDTTTAETLTTASFSPPAGSILVAQVVANCTGDGTNSMAVTVSDSSGLTWTKQASDTQTVGSATYEVVSIWTAVVPSTELTPPVFVAAYSPSPDWVSAASPKTQTVPLPAGDVLVVLGGTQSSTTTLGIPAGGPAGLGLDKSSAVSGFCAGYVWSAVASALQVTTASLPAATAGTAYSSTLTATGGSDTGFTWTVSAGALPVWAALNSSTGVISGTPTSGETGSSSFTAEVTDSAGNTATASLSLTVDAAAGTQPNGPSGSWTLAWNDEFNDATGMSGNTNGLSAQKWNVGWFYGPSSPGGTGYTGTSFTDSSGAGAIEFYGKGALAFPAGGGMTMSCYASDDGPDGASYNSGGHTSTSESGGVNTAGIMNITPNTSYSVPSDIASTVIQAASIVVEMKARMPGPSAAAAGYWAFVGFYNAGNSDVPDYPDSGYYEEIDAWEQLGNDCTGASYEFHLHEASTYNGSSSAPTSLQTTDLSLAYHTYTIEFTYSTMTMWIDGVEVTDNSPTAAECEAQWATPQYLNILFQILAGYEPTGSGGATPWMIDYVRVWTQA
jgi:hypothetical protein